MVHGGISGGCGVAVDGEGCDVSRCNWKGSGRSKSVGCDGNAVCSRWEEMRGINSIGMRNEMLFQRSAKTFRLIEAIQTGRTRPTEMA